MKDTVMICCMFPWLHKTGNSNYVYEIHMDFHSQQERTVLHRFTNFI